MSTQIEQKIGKIRDVHLGVGGYQGAQFGLRIELGGGRNQDWSVVWTKMVWSKRHIKDPKKENCKWTKEDRRATYADITEFLDDTMEKANVDDFQKLVGTPVVVTFDGNSLKEWRVLEEAI